MDAPVGDHAPEALAAGELQHPRPVLQQTLGRIGVGVDVHPAPDAVGGADPPQFDPLHGWHFPRALPGTLQ